VKYLAFLIAEITVLGWVLAKYGDFIFGFMSWVFTRLSANYVCGGLLVVAIFVWLAGAALDAAEKE